MRKRLRSCSQTKLYQQRVITAHSYRLTLLDWVYYSSSTLTGPCEKRDQGDQDRCSNLSTKLLRLEEGYPQFFWPWTIPHHKVRDYTYGASFLDTPFFPPELIDWRGVVHAQYLYRHTKLLQHDRQTDYCQKYWPEQAAHSKTD